MSRPVSLSVEKYDSIRLSQELLVGVHYERLGSMVLLPAKKNSDLGNKPFSDKKAALSASGYALTSEVAKETDWGVQQITARQKRLAKLAVQTWPMKLPRKS